MDLVDATLYCAMLDAEKTVWDIFDEVTPAFCALAENPDSNSFGEQLKLLEHFIVLIDDHTSTDMKENEARKNSFLRKVDQ